MKHTMIALAFLAACSSSASAPRPAAVAPMPSSAPALEADRADVVLALAGRRARVLDWLHAYREAGAYPTGPTGMPASVFVDADGVRCPMAELVFRSGREDLVAAVAQEANDARLADVGTGPLHDWMLASGLTRNEIDMIQGVMNVDLGWMQLEPTGSQVLAGHAQVRGKLEIAEVALRDNTAAALAIAASQVPSGQSVAALARAPVTQAVLPESAVVRARRASLTAPSRGDVALDVLGN